MTTRCLNLRRDGFHVRGPRSASRLVSILALLLVAFVGLAPAPSQARAAQNLPAKGRLADRLHRLHRLSTHGAQLPPELAQALSQKGLMAAANNQQLTQQELQASDGGPGDEFGVSVALSANGHVALIGAGARDNFKGAAYVFQERGGNWTQQQELQASDGVVGDAFGYSVALSSNGNVALVGAVGKDAVKGAAYVFQERGGNWTQQQELQASDGASFDFFGSSVTLNSSGNVALVGAYLVNSFVGAAYVFQERGGSWTQQQELQASDGAWFGNSVALSSNGNVALVGAPYGGPDFKGAAYVFQERGGSWTQQQELLAGDGASFDQFGISVALSAGGKVALVGAFGKDSANGAAYVFQERHGTWAQQQELQGVLGDAFGYSVALSSNGNAALVGAVSGGPDFRGAAYIFQERGGNWTQEQVLLASDGVPNDAFGYSAALSANGHVAIVGAPRTFNSGQGAAYVFTNDNGH
jgi:hypothetical protein